MDDVSANRAQQAQIYGAPLSDVMGHCAAVLGLNQQQLAAVLGLSAPMVSQLINGHRIKIANPAAAERLRQLNELVAQVDDGQLSAADALQRMNDQASEPPRTALTTRTGTLSDDVQAIFRATASASDYLAAARLVQEQFPEVAELLLVYGTERSDRAHDHTQRLRRS